MTHVGSNVSTMRLSLKDWDGAVVADLADDTKMLGYYSPRTAGPSTSRTQRQLRLRRRLARRREQGKYTMSDEDYNKREGTYRQWKQEQLAKDPTWCLEAMAERRGSLGAKKVIEDGGTWRTKRRRCSIRSATGAR